MDDRNPDQNRRALGLVLGLSYRRGRSLPRRILAHTAFNLAITYGGS